MSPDDVPKATLGCFSQSQKSSLYPAVANSKRLPPLIQDFQGLVSCLYVCPARTAIDKPRRRHVATSGNSHEMAGERAGEAGARFVSSLPTWLVGWGCPSSLRLGKTIKEFKFLISLYLIKSDTWCKFYLSSKKASQSFSRTETNVCAQPAQVFERHCTYGV